MLIATLSVIIVFGTEHSAVQWEIHGLSTTVTTTEPSTLAGLLTFWRRNYLF